MTISSTENRATYTGNGVTTVFAFGYLFFANADLVVVKRTISTGVDVVQSITTHYTVSGAGNPAGGNVTMLTAPTSDEQIIIYRDPAVTQQTDFVDNDPLPAASLETVADKLTMIAQRLKELTNRALRQPDGDVTNIGILPPKITRLSKYLGFDNDGNPVALAAPVGTTGVSAFMATVLDDADAATAAVTLGVIANALLTTRGDLVYRNATVPARLAIGAANRLLQSNGTDPTWADPLTVEVRFPRAYIDGFTISNNATDATNDFDVAIGEAQDDANSHTIMRTTANVVKQLDVAFAEYSSPSTPSGGRDSTTNLTGAKWFHVYVISGTGKNVQPFASTSLSPTLPTGFTQKRRIGSMYWNGSTIIGFVQIGDTFRFKSTPGGVELDTSTPATTPTTLGLAYVPTGLVVGAILGVRICANAQTDSVQISSLAENASEPDYISAWPLASLGGNGSAVIAELPPVHTNTSGQIRYETINGTAKLVIATRGWVDYRGKHT